MKKFLFKIALFFSPLVILVFCLDLWISNTLAHSGSYAMGDAKIWSAIMEGEIKDEILIYGSSRAWRHFDPQFIEEQTGRTTYNFGVDGHSFDIQYLRHRLNLKYGKKPKIIIYSVDINTLNAPNGLYNDEQFLPFFYSDSLINSCTKKYENFSFSEYNFPLLRYMGRKKALTYFAKEVLNKQVQNRRTTKGFGTTDREWNDDFKKASEKKDSYYKSIKVGVVKRFDEFLVNAKASGISVALMYTPEHVLGQNLVENRWEIVKVFDSLAKKNKIPFFDYSQDKMNISKEYFYNSMHLNTKGVKQFNKLYIGDLINFIHSIKENGN